MKASIVDLRYRMNDILKALDRNESVEISHYGKIKGTIIPAGTNKKTTSIKEDEFFGFLRDQPDALSVEDTVNNLRTGRYRDI